MSISIYVNEVSNMSKAKPEFKQQLNYEITFFIILRLANPLNRKWQTVGHLSTLCKQSIRLVFLQEKISFSCGMFNDAEFWFMVTVHYYIPVTQRLVWKLLGNNRADLSTVLLTLKLFIGSGPVPSTFSAHEPSAEYFITSPTFFSM